MADLSSILDDALKFATPFAQKLIGASTAPETPKAVQAETLRNASLNGSGPNDPSLAKQAPLGLMDFITGLSGGQGATAGGVSNGLKSAGGIGWGVIAFAAVALVAVVLIIRK